MVVISDSKRRVVHNLLFARRRVHVAGVIMFLMPLASSLGGAYIPFRRLETQSKSMRIRSQQHNFYGYTKQHLHHNS
eukprot:COSAG02_NODE_7106_length_3182_cov_4.943904_3_plen_77_part_00